MIQHPGVLLAEYLKENGYTQKDFSKKIGKKNSEINELIRGKRNITVARDIILTKYLSTKPKFWILKQVDFDYEQTLLKEQNNTEFSHKEDNVVLKQNKDNTTILPTDNNSPSVELTIQDILNEEKSQSKYLKENIFQEIPLYESEKEEKENVEDKKFQNTNNIPIEELLKEDPITEYTPLSDLFDSF